VTLAIASSSRSWRALIRGVVRDEVGQESKTGRKAVTDDLSTASCIVRDSQLASAQVFDSAVNPTARASNCDSNKAANSPAAAGPASRN
jgi:hypothetical protein